MAVMLDVDNLIVRYGEAVILENLTFSLEEGEWLMIVGPNGAGKSTTISAITQSVPYTGTVRFEGEDLRTKKSMEVAQCIGVLMQKHSAEFAFRSGISERMENFSPPFLSAYTTERSIQSSDMMKLETIAIRRSGQSNGI